MKRLLEWLKEFWEANGKSIRQLAVYATTLGWFGYTSNIVKNSDSGTVGKVFFFVWSAFLILYFFICYFEDNK